MILYHGSNIAIEKIDLENQSLTKTLERDFIYLKAKNKQWTWLA